MNLELLFYPIIIAYFIRTVRNVLYQTFLWQLKEYRPDRFIANLKTPQGKKLLLGPVTIFKWILLFIIFGLILSEYKLIPSFSMDFESLGFFAYLLFAVIWIMEALLNLWELVTRGWKIPVLTPKIIIILAAVLVISFNPVFRSNNGLEYILNQLSDGVFLDKLLAPSVFIFVMLLNIPSLIFRKIIVAMAKRKLSRYKNLQIIGITGSYGKTSTKEFLYAILSANFRVIKTEEYQNTEIAVAKTIINKLKPNHEIFIVEMGAYKKGEIKAICEMVKPRLGVITGINQQHLELFGSIDKIMKAKFELIENLNQKGVAIFNFGNEYIRKMVEWTKVQRDDVSIYGYDRDNKLKKQNREVLTVSKVKVFPQKLCFNLIYKEKIARCETKLAGLQNLDNILGAVMVSLKLGMDLKSIRNSISHLLAPQHTMKVISGTNSGITLIDDTFNTNPAGVRAVLEYMSIFNGSKILVLTPMIELGRDAFEIHKSLSFDMAKSCDKIILTNSNYFDAFRSGMGNKNYDEKIQIANINLSIEKLVNELNKDSVVVFSGKEAGKILKELCLNTQ